MQPRTPRVQIGSRQRAAMAGLAAAFAAATLAAMAHATTTGSPPLSPSSQPWSSSYYAAVENRLSAGGGMLLVCRALAVNSEYADTDAFVARPATCRLVF